MIPKVVAFDLDGTLAVSKSPLTEEMAGLLSRLCARTTVAITSGGAFKQLMTQVVERLPADTRRTHLMLLPTSGAALYAYTDGAWTPVYEKTLSAREADAIRAAIDAAVLEAGVDAPAHPAYGERTEFRGSQVTFSALGQAAPVEEKYAWDPDQAKRRAMLVPLLRDLPDYDVKIGGATSIDVTKKGITKAYGLRKLSAHLSIPIAEMLYVGDALFPGGNDEVVKETGIRTRAVAHPDETARVIEELLATAY